MNLIKQFEEIGFTNTEAKTYLSLLDLGESLAGAIAFKSKLYRKNVYDALNRMLQRGVVTYTIKRGKKYWNCVNPERIKRILEEKLDNFNSVLPSLMNKFDNKKPAQTVEIYEGLGGMKSILELILKERKTLYCFGATNIMFERMKYYAPNVVKRGALSGLKGYFLYNYGVKVTELSEIAGGLGKLKRSKNKRTLSLSKFYLRYLPKNFKTATQLFLFGDYSIIYIWSEEPIAILIKNSEINKGFKRYFNFMWKLSA